ncbi:putative ABC transport system ATP-binding protein [Alteromonas sp. 76-1]|nr:putative ABC transport system ATP-binding protein [Alteromonas sp. 76-1]
MNNSTNLLIKMENINKIFYTDKLETHALSGFDFEIHKGDYVSISGPSGCGKSTLLSILGLLDSPTNGKFILNNFDVSNLSVAQRAKIRNREIGFIFQDFNLIGDLTVFQNVELPLTFRNMPKEEREANVIACLAKVGMDKRADHLPSQLSGGQQQRVAVARALVGKPSILLADEPTGNLDSKNGDAVMQLLEELNQEGVTICIVTHDSRYADYAKRIVKLFDGKIVGDLAESNIELYPDKTLENV